MNQYVLWLQLVTGLAAVVAKENGQAPRELAYLELLTKASTLVALTDEDLRALKEKYEYEVANDVPTSAEDLQIIVQRIHERGQRIQSA